MSIVCVTDCGSGYVVVNGIYTPCPVTYCDKCDPNNIGTCLSCKNLLYLYTNQCLPNCPPSTFNTADLTCRDYQSLLILEQTSFRSIFC